MPAVCGITLPIMPTPEMLSGIIGVIQADAANDLYKQYRDIIDECVEANMQQAERLTATIKSKAVWHADMNEEACNMPEYNACATAPQLARYDVIREAAAVRTKRVRILDRGQIGFKSQLDRETSIAVLSATMTRQMDIKRVEEARELEYLDQCLAAMVDATMVGTFPQGAANALGRAGDGLTVLSNGAQGRLQAGLTTVGTAVGQYFNRRQESAYQNFVSAQQRYIDEPGIYGRPTGLEGSTVTYSYDHLFRGPHL